MNKFIHRTGHGGVDGSISTTVNYLNSTIKAVTPLKDLPGKELGRPNTRVMHLHREVER